MSFNKHIDRLKTIDQSDNRHPTGCVWLKSVQGSKLIGDRSAAESSEEWRLEEAEDSSLKPLDVGLGRRLCCCHGNRSESHLSKSQNVLTARRERVLSVFFFGGGVEEALCEAFEIGCGLLPADTSAPHVGLVTFSWPLFVTPGVQSVC